MNEVFFQCGACGQAPARLFMGDGGSYLIGFLIAMMTLSATFAGGSLPRHAILAPLCVLAVPLYDTASVVWIRLRDRRSPFEGDESHFSHRLVELGLSRKHAVWTIYLATATCGLGALLLHQLDARGAILVLVLVACVLTIIAILASIAVPMYQSISVSASLAISPLRNPISSAQRTMA